MKIIECPRDAMQGIKEFIPTAKKAAYINQLLKVGFDTIDFGSFVSVKAIPQLKDTAAVLEKLDLSSTQTKLLAIVANVRGAEDALSHEEINAIGYPFSISEMFQLRNTNKTIDDALNDLDTIKDLCLKKERSLVTYISMGFGNPYNEEWSVEGVAEWVDRLRSFDLKIISLSDTIGAAKPEDISYLFSTLNHLYPDVEIGAHFHSHPDKWYEKIEAAYKGGCKRFDGALKGFGGCPMAKDELTGNIATENIVQFLEEEGVKTGIDQDALQEALIMANSIFPQGTK
ncbi:MAG: hydroxymethylglutaryl-CoA lyase [Bacteroidia bacterium]